VAALGHELDVAIVLDPEGLVGPGDADGVEAQAPGLGEDAGAEAWSISARGGATEEGGHVARSS
jgi:hypothetical protein